LETLAEIIIVIILAHIIPTIAVVGVLIGKGVLEVGAPAILAVRLSGEKALLIPVVHALPKHIGAVLIRFVILAATIVPIVRSGVEVWVVVVIVILEVHLLLAFLVIILLIITVLRHAVLSLEFPSALLVETLLVVLILPELSHSLLLLPY